MKATFEFTIKIDDPKTFREVLAPEYIQDQNITPEQNDTSCNILAAEELNKRIKQAMINRSNLNIGEAKK